MYFILAIEMYILTKIDGKTFDKHEDVLFYDELTLGLFTIKQ